MLQWETRGGGMLCVVGTDGICCSCVHFCVGAGVGVVVVVVVGFVVVV